MSNEMSSYWPENHHIDEKKEQRAAEHFVKGVLARGEAAERLPDGTLPPGVTHEIIETKEGELPKIRLRRFSLV